MSPSSRSGHPWRAVLALSAFSVLVGCSLLVSGDPELSCDSDLGCPAGNRCAPATRQCIAASEACSDTSCAPGSVCDPGTLACVQDALPADDAAVGADADAVAPGTDSGVDAAPSQVDFGASCVSITDCSNLQADGAPVRKAGLCLTSALSGVGNLPNLCTTTCCSSDECPASFYCGHTPSAGRYCLPFGGSFTNARTAPVDGERKGGEACDVDDECRSGSCRDGFCNDVCCTDRDCTAVQGDVCQYYSTMEGTERSGGFSCRQTTRTVRFPGACGTLGNLCRAHACLVIEDEAGDEVDEYCTAPCCSNADCGTSGGPAGTCEFGGIGNQRLNICVKTSGQAPRTSCTEPSQCSTNMCDQGQCAATCCTDGDCLPSERCLSTGSEVRPHCVALGAD